MFYLKLIVVAALGCWAILQVVTLGFSFFGALNSPSKIDYKGTVVEVVALEPNEKERPPGLGHITVEYKDHTGKTAREDMSRSSSIGPTEYFNSKVGDTIHFSKETTDRNATGAYRNYHWSDLQKFFFISALLFMIGGIVFYL